MREFRRIISCCKHLKTKGIHINSSVYSLSTIAFGWLFPMGVITKYLRDF